MSHLTRLLLASVVVVLAVVLQVAALPVVAVNGVVPNLVLLVVVAASVVRGPGYGAVVALVAGLLLDLAPPADHVVGQWALAFVVAAALAGRVRSEVRDSPLAVVGLVAVCSFVASSLFALTGLVLGDLTLPPGQLLQVVLIALLWDVVVAPVVVPLLLPVFERPVSHELAA
ncbi:rod shape-determining protein MreD [Nocardioides marmoraquaticus]